MQSTHKHNKVKKKTHPGVVTCDCNLNTQEGKAVRAGIQGYPWLCSYLKASLSYIRLSKENKNKQKKQSVLGQPVLHSETLSQTNNKAIKKTGLTP